MSEEINLEEIKKFWPKDAPDVTNVPKYIKKYKKNLIVINMVEMFLSIEIFLIILFKI